jgi:tetratricopeptide (TPR) repeat protein
VASFDAALRLEPGAGKAQRNRELAMKMKGTARPVLDPDTHLDALLDTGAAMSSQGKSEEAIQYFRAAVDFAPRSVEARIYLALGLAKANKNKEALEQLTEASRIDARGANGILTKALRLPEKSTNLEDIMNRLRAVS